MQKDDERFGILISLPGAIVLFLWVIIPTIILLTTSFLRYDNLSPIVFHGLKNYTFALDDRVFWLSFKRTLVFCGGVTAITFVIGMVIATSLSRIHKASNISRSLAMFPWAVPAIVSGLIWSQMFNPSFGVINDLLVRQLGFLDEAINIFGNPQYAMIGVIVADAWIRIPFMTIILLAGLESIDPNLYEAARVDGADRFQMLRRLVFPLIKKPALTGILITAIFSFRTIDNIFSMTLGGPGKATYVFGFYILDYIYRYFNFGVAGAVSVMMIIILILIGLFFIVNIVRRED
jgi:multiple sugar transport system permease protein